MSEVSFGVEFEFDIITKNNNVIAESWPRGKIVTDGWSIQDDPTAVVELRTPIFIDIYEAVNSIKKQFRYWCRMVKCYAPYSYNDYYRSIGTHIHIGLKNRMLNKFEKKRIAYSIANIYNFLVGLHAQPIPSTRGLFSQYAIPIYNYTNDIPIADHYAEISDSEHGTVEFRAFDSNIPQVTLTCISIMHNIAKKIINNDNNFWEIDISKYKLDKNKVLHYGLSSIGIAEYIQKIINIISDEKIPNIPSIKEILYIAVKHKMSAFDILSNINVDMYKYMKKMFCNPHEYINNLLKIIDVNNINHKIKSAIIDTYENANMLEKYGDLINLLKHNNNKIIDVVFIPPHSKNLPLRTIVKQLIDNKAYRICRINQFTGISSFEVIDRIVHLIKYHGDGFLNLINHNDVINLPHRFYVFCVHDRDNQSQNDNIYVLGVVAIRVTTGEIRSIVVDRRYRRLGIGTRLLKHAIQNSEVKPFLYVAKNNFNMIRLIEKLGFVKTDEYDTFYRYEYMR